MVQVIAGFYMCSLLQGKGELGFEPGSLDDWNCVRSEVQQQKKSVKWRETRKKNSKFLLKEFLFGLNVSETFLSIFEARLIFMSLGLR